MCDPGQSRRMVARMPDAGFTLAEFLAAATILLIVAGSAFSVLADIQRTAGYQGEIQNVLESTRTAMDTATRYIRQCGNDPQGIGFEGLEIIDDGRVRLRSDVTGSAGATNPDKGDPDGDTLDASEDVTLRFNRVARTLEIAGAAGGSQVVAANISAFSMEYFDENGQRTQTGGAVRRVRLRLTGESSLSDPRTRKTFSLALDSDVQISTRQ